MGPTFHPRFDKFRPTESEAEDDPEAEAKRAVGRGASRTDKIAEAGCPRQGGKRQPQADHSAGGHPPNDDKAVSGVAARRA
jgi:hypothetical protein